MPEQPLYNGARTQLGDGATPLATPNIGIDASQKAIQRGAFTLDEAVKSYFKIQDFGEDQRIESEVRRLQSKFDAEFQRRASLAPGSSSQALYDSDGTLRDSVLQDLSDDFAHQVGELRGGFVLPESRMKSDAMRQRVGDDFINKAYQKATLLGIQRTRQAFETNLQLTEEKEDWNGHEVSIYGAEKAGIITHEQAELLRVKGSKIRYEKQQENLKTALFSSIAADPVRAAASINKGLYNDLNPLDLDRAKREVRSRLAYIATPAPLTAEDRRNIQEKNIKALKQQLPNGATEQMWKWARNAQKNGGQFTEQDKVEIRGAFSMELDKLPVPKDRDEARQIATRTIQKWAKLGAYDGNEEYIRAVVMDKLDSRLDAAKGARRNDIGLVLRHIPDGAYIPNRSASVEDAYRKGDRQKIQEKEAARNLVESQIEEHVRVQMAY